MSFFLNRAARGWGQRARERRIERTGKDPADNPVTNGFNRWARAHPWGYRSLAVLMWALAIAVAVWKLSS